MKKVIVIVLVAVLLVGALTIPAAAFGPQGVNDQAWRHNHEQTWKTNEKQWSDHDRQWREHSNDQKWREEHMSMWHDWYQWHRDNESVLKIKVSPDSQGGPKLDIDYRNEHK
jgi:hypothetical protein